MKLRIIPAPNGRGLLMVDDAGTVLPLHNVVEVATEVGPYPHRTRVTVDFTVDGDMVALANNAGEHFVASVTRRAAPGTMAHALGQDEGGDDEGEGEDDGPVEVAPPSAPACLQLGLDPVPTCTIQQVADDVQRLADWLGVIVNVTYDEVGLRAMPGSKASLLVDTYVSNRPRPLRPTPQP